MKKRALGKAGLSVAEIGLGCMGMSWAYGQANEQAGIKVIERAIELGVDFFDTAEVYGPYTNERLVGKALKGKRDRAVVATKFGFKIENGAVVGVDSHPRNVRRACDDSLSRLGLEYIDLFYQHRFDPQIPIEEVVGTMAELVEAGKVRFLGLSEVGSNTLRRASREHQISCLQSEYSIWERNLEDGVLDTCRELGIGLVAYCPLGRGLLSGELKSVEALPEDDYRRKDPRYQGDNFKKNLELVEVVKRIAGKHGATPAQVAIAWTLSQGEEIVPIPGTKRVAYLEKNIEASHLVLDRSDLEELDGLHRRTAGARYSPEQMARIER